MKKLFIVLTISIISVFSVSAQTEFTSILSQIHADSLKKTVEDLVAFDNRLCCATVGHNRKVAQYIVERLRAYGVENAAIDSFPVKMNHWLLKDIDQYMYNVRSRLSGSVNSDSIAIIGAHLDAIAYVYDSGYIIQNSTPGANDNATGVAVMIEVARIFHANNLIPKYSIDFMAYDAEEIGLFGSIDDAKKRSAANEKVYVMLNNDMVGLQEESAFVWNVIFHADADDVQDKATKICQKYTRLYPRIPDNLDSSYRNSDSWSYRIFGFRTFYTHSFEDDQHYHTLSDTPQRLNYRYMAEIAKLHFSLLYDFAIDSIIEGTTINEPSITSTFTLYPNPTTGQLTIVMNNEQLTINNVEIYSITGQLLQSKIVNPQSKIETDVSHLAKGMYFLKIENQVVRFLKE